MNQHTQLSDDLAALRAHYAAHMPPDIAQAMNRADLSLTASDLINRSIKAGELAPDFTLPDSEGRPVRLSQELASGPVILNFYRGDWCPYCNLELRAYAAHAAEIAAIGARLIAISPQRPDSSRTGDKFPFSVVSDEGSRIAKEFGIAFDLAEELRPLYTRLGHALPEMNGSGWMLPVPATYVVATSGEVVLGFVDTNYRHRLEPSQAIAAAAAAAQKKVA